jgi:hypothetical protein
VPDSALKGKKVAYVACSDLNRWCREFRHQIVPALEAKGVIVTDLQDHTTPFCRPSISTRRSLKSLISSPFSPPTPVL